MKQIYVHLALYFHAYCSQVIRSLALPHDLPIDINELVINKGNTV